MSRENVEPVRQRIAFGDRPRRSLEERMYLRFPRGLVFLTRRVQQLPPRSRLRQALVRRAVQLTWAATNRGDWAVAFVLYHPDHETIPPPGLVSVGFDPLYRGRTKAVQLQRRWQAEWGEFRYQPEEIIDFGERALVLGRVQGSGLTSGAAFNSEWGMLYTSAAGRIMRDQIFLSWNEALEAAGLTE